MAIITVYDHANRLGSIDLSNVDLDDVHVSPPTSTHLTASVNGLTLTLQGSFFYTDARSLSLDSQVHSVNLSYQGSLVASGSGFNVTFHDIYYGDFDTVMSGIMAGDDVFTSAYNGDDYIETFGGNDRIKTGTGSDYVDGGSGFDVFVANGARSAYDITLNYGTLVLSGPGAEQDQLRNIERIEFLDGILDLHVGSYSSENRSFAGHTGPALLFGVGGNDTLTGGNGNDTLDGGSGSDRLSGDLGSDVLIGGSGDDQLFGGADNDTLLGGDYDDTLKGGTEADRLVGGSGDDRLLGEHGHDVLLGDSGRDHLNGGSGWDKLKGGSGDDTLIGEDGRDRLVGGRGADDLSGGNHHDALLGGGGDDDLLGGSGRDTLSGQSGDDSLNGGNGNDRLAGDGGKDVLIGHKGDDLLTGGKHADVFVFHRGHGNDTITDFEIGRDHIEIGRGASRFGQLDFTQQGEDVLVAFADVTILVEDTTLAQLQDTDNFLF